VFYRHTVSAEYRDR